MQAIAHNATFAKKAGVPQSVGREFNQADKKKKRKRFHHPKTGKPM